MATSLSLLLFLLFVEALWGHPRDSKKVSVSGAGHLQERFSVRELVLFHCISIIPVNLCVPALFHYATPLSPLILPYVSFVSVIHFACAFISVYATHIICSPCIIL